MARRIQLDVPHLVRQTILNGLQPAIQMNVRLQRPVTIEDIAAAAAIAETAPGAATQPEPPASAAATTGGTTTTNDTAGERHRPSGGHARAGCRAHTADRHYHDDCERRHCDIGADRPTNAHHPDGDAGVL